MKSTSRSQEASPHLSWGSQIAQVTVAATPHTWSTHPLCPNHTAATLHQDPAAICSLYFICLLKLEWQQPESELPSCSPSLFIFILESGMKYPSWFHTEGEKKKKKKKRKRKKNIQEMKVVTRSSVCQTSPWAGTKGPEKSCWDYFSLQMTEEEGGCLRETWMDKDRKTDNGIFRLARN